MYCVEDILSSSKPSILYTLATNELQKYVFLSPSEVDYLFIIIFLIENLYFLPILAETNC
jgi:hypothetical protein